MRKLLVVLTVVSVFAFAGFAFADHDAGFNPTETANNANSAATSPSSTATSYYSSATTTVNGVTMSYSSVTSSQLATLSASDVTEAASAATNVGVKLNLITPTVNCANVADHTVIWVALSDAILNGYKSDHASLTNARFFRDKGLSFEVPNGTMWIEGLINGSYTKLTADNVDSATEAILCFVWDDVKGGFYVGEVDAAEGDYEITGIAVSGSGSDSSVSLGSSGGGCSTGMSALAFGVLGLFLACRKK